MTVAETLKGARYVGLSTDTKPASPTTGARFVETDTGMEFEYDGSGWVQVSVDLDATATATIANGQTKSGEVDLGSFKLAGLILPSDLDGATTVTFEAASASGGTFVQCDDEAGTQVSVTVAVSRAVSLGDLMLDMAPWRYIKVVLGDQNDSGSNINITLVLKR